uniref:Myb-like domain-containing protein n=1 Tax=Chenopodium quinoa TaxID=63459 RepID=A0A803MXX4_CHEQI
MDENMNNNSLFSLNSNSNSTHPCPPALDLCLCTNTITNRQDHENTNTGFPIRSSPSSVDGLKGENCQESLVAARNVRRPSKLCSRGHWRPAEDTKLKELVLKFGPQNWNVIAEKLQGRSGSIEESMWKSAMKGNYINILAKQPDEMFPSRVEFCGQSDSNSGGSGSGDSAVNSGYSTSANANLNRLPFINFLGLEAN